MTGEAKPAPKDWWTVSELAKRANVDSSYIRQLLLRKKLRGQKFGPLWRIPNAEAERWLAERKEP